MDFRVQLFLGHTSDEQVEFSNLVGKYQTLFAKNDFEQAASILHQSWRVFNSDRPILISV